MGRFSAIKGTLKLKDIDEIEILSERNEHGLFIHLQANLRKGKVRQIGRIRFYDEEKIHARRHLVSFKLPSAGSWKDAFAGLKPDELKLAVGPEPVSATWRFKKD